MDQYIESISSQRNANLAEQVLLERHLKNLKEIEAKLSNSLEALIMVKEAEEKKAAESKKEDQPAPPESQPVTEPQ